MTAPDHPLRSLLLVLALAVGFALRINALDTYGLSEDEAAKVQAIESYQQGRFSANAEHPMLMKLAMWGALKVRSAGAPVSVESAVRLPNVLAGSATVVVVAGAATLLFSPAVGAISGLLVAFDPNVIAINRLGKEDTFAVLFFFIAVWCYERAKRIGRRDLDTARTWYTCAGAAFGLLLASKYLPHLLGLYALFNVVHRDSAGGNAPDKRRYYAAMAGAFLVANFAVVLPSTWQYCAAYLQGRQLVHHGYLYDGQLYVTNTPLSLAGVPLTYYLRLMATKVSLPVLIAAAIGLVPLVRFRTQRGFVWLRVLLFFQVLGYSIFAAKFLRYSLPMLVLVDILAAIGVVAAGRALATAGTAPALRRVAAGALAMLVVAAPLRAAVSAMPYYSLNQNAVGARLAPPATVFPEEAYDFGVREAVAEIASHAARGAVVISEASGVVAHYCERSGREDLRVLSLSSSGIGDQGDRWIIVQNGQTYFENAESIAQLRRTHVPWREYRLGQTTVLELYHLPAPESQDTRRAVRKRRGATAGSS